MKQKLVEGEDFYFNETGLMVMTEKYHLERGYCCSNKCRHCPYGYINVAEPASTYILDTAALDAKKEE